MKLTYTRCADALAVAYGIPRGVFSMLISAESSWDPSAVSKTGCKGLGQFCSAAAIEYGLLGRGYDNRFDAALSMTAMAMYLSDLYSRYGTWRRAIEHYSGQIDPSLGIYATYTAGRLLIMAVDAADAETPPTAKET